MLYYSMQVVLDKVMLSVRSYTVYVGSRSVFVIYIEILIYCKTCEMHKLENLNKKEKERYCTWKSKNK